MIEVQTHWTVLGDTYSVVDQAPLAVLNRVRLQLKQDADYLLKGRVRVVK